jgi:hypothetical protein
MRNNQATSLAVLDLSNDAIGDEGCVSLANALGSGPLVAGLSVLSLRSNAIGAAGACLLAEVLEGGSNTTLSELCLAGNAIGDAAAAALARALAVNTTVTKLDISKASVGDPGALALAEMLQCNATLTALDLGGNSIGNPAADALIETLKLNASLTRLTVNGNPMDRSKLVKITSATRTNESTAMQFAALDTPALTTLLARGGWGSLSSALPRIQAEHACIARLATILCKETPNEPAITLARDALASPIGDHPASHVLRRKIHH